MTWDSDTGTADAQDGGGNWTVGGATFWNGSTDVASTNIVSGQTTESGGSNGTGSTWRLTNHNNNFSGAIHGNNLQFTSMGDYGQNSSLGTFDGSGTTGSVLNMASGSVFDWDLSANGSGSPDQINFWNYNAGGNAISLSYIVVPEPSNVLIGGLLGVGLLRRRA